MRPRILRRAAEMTKTVHAIIRGGVQGVGYRIWCQRQAAALGLAGWVRNRRSGDVEAVFSGPDEAVDRMLAAAQKGPPGARVDAIDTAAVDALDADGFEIRMTT